MQNIQVVCLVSFESQSLPTLIVITNIAGEFHRAI